MTVYTDARALPGKKGTAGVNERELMLRAISDLVLTAHEEKRFFIDHAFSKSITAGQSEKFPTIGRLRNAAEHAPGEIILGNPGAVHDEKEVTLDNILVSAQFLAEIDVLQLTYDLMAPYATQIGEDLAVTYDKRTAIMHVLAARNTTPDYPGGPIGQNIVSATMRTDPAQLEAAAFTAAEHLLTNDLGTDGARFFIPWKEYLLLSKFTGIDSEATSGSGDRSQGKVGLVAGMRPEGANHIPSTNITTGLTKYQGNFSTTVGFISKPRAVARLKRRGMKLVIKQQDDRLGTLMIGSALEGLGRLRQELAVELKTA